MKMSGMRWATLCVVGLVVAIAAGQAMAMPVIVVPAGLDNVEGSTAIRHQTSDTPRREQQHYGSPQFGDMGPVNIVGYRLRPDKGQAAGARTITYTGVQIYLSTTPSGPNLSPTYADNTGPDATLVYSGDLVLTTNPTNPGVGPNAFDMEVLFEQPFPYDPANGPLLVDFTATGISGDVRFDAQWVYPSARRIIWSNPALAVANNGNGQVVVRQFIIPEPSSLLLTAIGLVGLIGCGWRRGT